MILHIPHSSYTIPDELRDQIILSDDDLSSELNLLTDAFTEDLFSSPNATAIIFPLSRILVDVERFPDDNDEPMSRAGMGMIYSRTTGGKALKRPLHSAEKEKLVSLYQSHHLKLTAAVQAELADQRKALIVDCHSFPSRPLPCDTDQSMPRPQVCIGTDPIHTPESLATAASECAKAMGYVVALNRPYAGSLVPLPFYQKDARVASIMVEINRSLYLDEATGLKTSDYGLVKQQMSSLLDAFGTFEH